MASERLSNWLQILENRHSNEIQLGLDRISKVAEKLDLISFDAKVITIGGTNGKGSTVALLESIYSQAGYRIGSYTSPHLLNFNERIKLCGKAITDEDLIRAFELIEEARGEIVLTYFEITTLAAFWYFKQQSLDLIILEVGLGGRLDATNIINPDLAIITTISYDHLDFLGATLEEIGFEKAGILRPNIPFIYADFNPPESIIAKASALDTSFYLNGRDYFYNYNGNSLEFFYKDQNLVCKSLNFHPNSIAAAIMATLCMQNFLPLDYEQIQNGIQQTQLAGRLHSMQTEKSDLIFDVSHNVQAVSQLASFIKTNYKSRKIHIVFSAFSDKDIEGMIETLKDLNASWYPCLLSAKRSTTETQIMKAFEACFLAYDFCYNTPVEAYTAAYNRVLAGELIVVCGSFITVSSVLSFLLQSPKRKGVSEHA